MAEWFPFSSTFYLDMDDAGVSERAQMLLIRCIAYIAQTENLDGYISKVGMKKLGYRSVTHRVAELVAAGIAVETEDCSGYVFPAFQKWGQPLIAHVRKKNRDREYQSGKRKEPKESYDNRATDRTIVDPQRREEKRTTTYVGSSLTSVDASASNAQAPISDEWQPNPAHRAKAHTMALDADRAADAFRNHALSVDRRCAGQRGWDAAFHNWLAKTRPDQQPGAPKPSTTDQRVASVQALKNNSPALRGLPS